MSEAVSSGIMDGQKDEWLVETTEVDRSLFATVKQIKLLYFGHIPRRSGDCLEKEVIQGTRGRPTTSHHGLVYHYTSYWKEQGIGFNGE